MLTSTCGIVCSDYSARSRVRGYLEIYHAYLRNSTPTGEERSDGDWQIVSAEEPTSVSRVNIEINYSSFIKKKKEVLFDVSVTPKNKKKKKQSISINVRIV